MQVHPTTSRRWHDEAEALGHARIDAPVSGGVKVSPKQGNLLFGNRGGEGNIERCTVIQMDGHKIKSISVITTYTPQFFREQPTER